MGKKIPQNCAYISWFKEEGGNISVDFPLFASLYKTKFITKIKFNDFLILKSSIKK